ncbi:MAG: metallophosphoesterase family protein [Myxococcaceae bacterium]
MRFSRPVALVLSLTLLGFAGCKENKPEAPLKPATPVEAPPPPPPKPAEVKEPVADKECAAPIDVVPSQDVQVGTRKAVAAGYKLSFSDKDADGKLVLGVLGPLNEDSGANLLTIKKYLKFFADEKADAIVVTGDVGEVSDGIARVLKALADSKLPVMVIAGNRECRAEFTDGVAAAQKASPNVVNMNAVRVVEFPEATLVSLPGYHDANYINCATGCRYYKSTVDEVIRVAKEAKNPVVLVAHGPPHGEGSQALDYATGGGNVGDEDVARAIRDGNIPFGVFSNIKEAGARATDLPGTTLIKQSTPAKALYLNPGPADSVEWGMNDNTKSAGLAAVLSIKGTDAQWKLFRAKPLTPAEKTQAKALEPPARPDPAEAPAPKDPAPPKPPPGQPAQGEAPKQ